MNIFDRILNRNDYQMAPLQPVEGANSAGYMPDGRLAGVGMEALQGVQIDADGNAVNADIQPMRDTRPKNNTSRGQRIVNYILGTPTGPADNVGQVMQNENGDVVINASINDNPRKGGLLNDFTAGYQDNRFNSLNSRNLQPNPNKSWANRFGEGVGSLARLAESPLGRGLMMAGLVNATGGDSLQALAYGAQAGVGNQTNRMQDRLYRQSLVDDYGYTPEQVNSIRGYVNGDTYKNMAAARQMRDNAEYRNALLRSQQQSNILNQQLRQDQLNQQKEKNQFDRWAKSEDIKQGWERILNDKENNKNKDTNEVVANLDAVNEQLQRFEKTFDEMPGKLESNTFGRLRNKTGLQTPTEANFNSQRTLLFNKIARDLGGEKGVLSDQDIKRIEAALPTYTDSKAQKVAKMQAIYALLNDRYNAVSNTQEDNDPLGIR